MKLRIMLVAVLSASVLNAQLFINEIDYDQPGTDAAEFLELAGPAGTYNNVVVDLINGNGDVSYNTFNLGTITLNDEAGGYGFYVVGVAAVPNVDYVITPNTNAIQNGSPDGVQLSVGGAIVDGVAYEGTLNDLSGNPMESTNDGSNTYPESAPDTSFSRIGLDGSPWVVTTTTPGAINTGQTFDPNANYPPTANAGPDQTVDSGAIVTLDGSGSSDSDGTIVAYAWSQIAGPDVTLSATDQAAVTFTVPEVTETTTFSFQLTVTDDGDSTDTDYINITVYIVTNMSIAQARQQSLGAMVNITGVVISINWVSSTEYSIQDSTGGISLYYSGGTMVLNMGDQVQITGAIAEYNGKMEIIPASETDVTVMATGVALPEPVVLTVAQLNANGENYESQLIQINNVTNQGTGAAWPAAGSNANIDISDNNSDIAVMRIDKETDIDGTAEPIWPADVVGVATEYSGVYQILPRMLTDILVESNAPTFENLSVSPGWITSQNEIEVSVDVLPPDSGTTIQSINIIYGTDGSFLNSTEMWPDQGNTWLGIIPAQAANSKLQYKFQTTDNNGLTLESNAFTQMVASTTASNIADVQNAATEGLVVTVSGIITIGSGVLQNGVTNAYIQDNSGRGINLFHYNELPLERGDALTLVGEISYYGTRVEIAYFNYRLDSQGNDLPAPAIISVGEANNSAWEGTWTQFTGDIVDQYSAGGGSTYFIKSGSDTTAVRIWNSTGIDMTPLVNGTTWQFTGVGSEYNGTFQTLIGYTEDMLIITGANPDQPAIPGAFSLSQPYPNPFNPSTLISWKLPVQSSYAISIYDLTGRLIKTLSQGNEPAGVYHQSWNAAAVASGIYFVRFTTPGYTQTRKIMLLK